MVDEAESGDWYAELAVSGASDCEESVADVVEAELYEVSAVVDVAADADYWCVDCESGEALDDCSGTVCGVSVVLVPGDVSVE